MIYRKFPVLLRPGTANGDLNRSRHAEPKHRRRFRGHASRFERLAAAAEELPRWPPFLDVLFGAAARGPGGGGVVPEPLWVDEVMHRTYCMIQLTLRLEHQTTQQAEGATWSACCLGRAIALAGRLAELQIFDDEEMVPCSELLGEIAVGLLHLFRLPCGDIEARLTLEDIAMSARQRRALILATSAVVMQTIVNAMDRGCAPAISIDLAARGGGQWRLTVVGNDVWADDDARECNDIVDGLADILGAEDVRRFRRMSEFVTEVDFPCLEAGPPAAPKTSRMSGAPAWAHV